MQQMQIDFEAGLTRRFPSLMALCRAIYYKSTRDQAARAADMDLSPSYLSRKVADNPNDTANLTVEELERFIDAHGDDGKDVVYYLVEKYLEDPESRKDRARQMLLKMVPVLDEVMRELREESKDKSLPTLKSV